MVVILTPSEKRELKSQLHSLKPIVIVGSNGVSDSVLQEINLALDDHELIKVRLADEERGSREEAAAKICKATKAILIQSIGKVIAIYRKTQKS